jgi:hypothetical protein
MNDNSAVIIEEVSREAEGGGKGGERVTHFYGLFSTTQGDEFPCDWTTIYLLI